MNVGIVCHRWQGNTGEGWAAALTNMGHNASVFYAFDIYRTPAIAARLVGAVSPRAYSDVEALDVSALIEWTKTNSLELIIVNTPNRLPATQLRLLRSRCDAKLVCWTGDDPATQFHLMDSADQYDALYVSSHEWLTPALSQRAKDLQFLPYGADTQTYFPAPRDQNLVAEVAFIGTRYPDRERVLATLTSFNLKIWGWETGRWYRRLASSIRNFRGESIHARRSKYPRILEDHIVASRATPPEVRAICASAAVVLNINHPQVYRSLNPQTFNFAAAGAFQVVTGIAPELPEYGDLPGLLADWVTPSTAVAERIHAALAMPESERKALADRIRGEVLRRHTNEARMSEILRAV